MAKSNRTAPLSVAVEAAPQGGTLLSHRPADLLFLQGGTPQLWPALLVLAGGILATFALWKTVDATFEREERIEIEAAAQHLGTLGERWVEEELVSLESLLRLRALVSADGDAWRTHAELFLKEHPSISSGRSSPRARSAIRSRSPRPERSSTAATNRPGMPLSSRCAARCASGRAANGN